MKRLWSWSSNHWASNDSLYLFASLFWALGYWDSICTEHSHFHANMDIFSPLDEVAGIPCFFKVNFTSLQFYKTYNGICVCYLKETLRGFSLKLKKKKGKIRLWHLLCWKPAQRRCCTEQGEGLWAHPSPGIALSILAASHQIWTVSVSTYALGQFV